MQQLISKAGAEVKAGRPENAIQIYERILRDDPHNVVALQEAAETLRRADRFDEALQIALRAAKISPELDGVHSLLGNIYWGLKRYDEAESELRKAISLNSTISMHYSNLGGLLVAQHRIEEGLSLLQTSNDLDSKNWAAHFNLFTAYVDGRQLRKAFKEAWKTFQLRPSVSVVARILDYFEHAHRLAFATAMLALIGLSVIIVPAPLALIAPIVIIVYQGFVGVGALMMRKRGAAVLRFTSVGCFLVVLFILFVYRLSSFVQP